MKKNSIHHICSHCAEEADGNYLITLADVQLQTGKCSEGKDYRSRAHNKGKWSRRGVRKAFLEEGTSELARVRKYWSKTSKAVFQKLVSLNPECGKKPSKVFTEDKAGDSVIRSVFCEALSN